MHNQTVYRLRPWLMWGLSALFYLYEFLHRPALSVLVPELMREFHLSHADIGKLSAEYFYAYALVQLPVGYILDRYSVRRWLSLAALIVASGTLVMSQAHDPALLSLARLAIGAGSAFAFTGCLKLASAWLDSRAFSFAIGITNLLGVLGALLGQGPLAYMVGHLGWRQTFWRYGLFGIALSLLMHAYLRDKPFAQISYRSPSSYLYWPRNRQFWYCACFGLCMVAPIAIFTELWGASYIMAHYGLTRPAAASLSSQTFVGIAIGGPVFGYLADRLFNRVLWLKIGALGALCSTGIAIYCPPANLWFAHSLYLALGFFSSSMLLCFAINTQQVTYEHRGMSVAITNCLIMFGSAVFQQAVSHLLVGPLGIQDLSRYKLAFLAVPLAHLLALALSFHIVNPQGPPHEPTRAQ